MTPQTYAVCHWAWSCGCNKSGTRRTCYGFPPHWISTRYKVGDNWTLESRKSKNEYFSTIDSRFSPCGDLKVNKFSAKVQDSHIPSLVSSEIRLPSLKVVMEWFYFKVWTREGHKIKKKSSTLYLTLLSKVKF